jgi:hypothetical protein
MAEASFPEGMGRLAVIAAPIVLKNKHSTSVAAIAMDARSRWVEKFFEP